MKRVLTVILIFLLMMPLATACDKSIEASIKEVSITGIRNDELKDMIDVWQQKNGAYLVQNTAKNGEYYLYLNSFNLEPGTKATYFGSLTVDFEDDVMHIYYEEKEAIETKDIKNKVLYKIPIGKTPNVVKIYKNGVETSFEAVGTIEEK